MGLYTMSEKNTIPIAKPIVIDVIVNGKDYPIYDGK